MLQSDSIVSHYTLLSQPYRLLFLLAALQAATSIVVWLSGLSGWTSLPPNPTLWHAHEMLFGFSAAVIVGFVLTASGNWTGLKTSPPLSLLLLCPAWVVARIAALVDQSSAASVAAIADGIFLCLAASLVTRVLIRSCNRRNYLFIPFLWALAAIDMALHFSFLESQISLARNLSVLTVYLLAFLMVFMGGRVIPFFSGRRLDYQPVQWIWLNWLSILSALSVAVVIVLKPASHLLVGAALTAGLCALIRLVLWQSARVWHEPMLWILHIGYAWLGIAYLLTAAANLGWLQAPTLPVHAITVGALGCLGLGMMTRVALGHSGRSIEASPLMFTGFILVILAGVVRLGSYANWPLGGIAGTTLSSILWSMAFGLYVLYFLPRLSIRQPEGPS